MSYIVINEGLKTVAHNLWTRPIFGSNYGYKKIPTLASDAASFAFTFSKLGGTALDAIAKKFGVGALTFVSGTIFFISPMILSMIVNHFTNGPDYADKKYFDSMYKITDSLKKKLSKWCKESKVVDFSQEEKDQSVYDIDSPMSSISTLGASIFDKDRTNSLASDMEFLPQISNKTKFKDFAKESIATSVIYVIVPSTKNKNYIVFLTFDENKILRADSLSANIDRSNNTIKEFKVVNLKKFDTVKPSEYMK